MPLYKRPFPVKRVVRPFRPRPRPRPPRTFIPFEHTPEGKALQQSMNRGLNLATAIGLGNFMTREYRQKPLVTLQTATHPLNPNRTLSKKAPVNNLLVTSTKMPVVYKKTKKQATNSKNGPVKVTKKPFIPKAIKKELKEIKKSINVDKATHTYKATYATTLKSLTGRCNHSAINASALADIESACTNLRYYDPAVPGTLVTANASTGTFARDVFFKDFYFKLLLRNNYQVPCRVKVYLCKVKNDTNELPTATYTAAITDQVINAGVDETDYTIHLTDIERVKEVWNVDCLVDKVLEPGHEAVATHSTGAFNFDPSHADSYTNAYQQTFKGSVFVIRVEGILGHDTAAAEYTLLPAGVDILLTKKATIQYDAGVDLDDIYISDTLAQSFTNGGVCSLKPVADNIAYSVS